MAKLRKQSIKVHHLQLIAELSDSLKNLSFQCHPYLWRWSPDHAIKAGKRDMSRSFLLDIKFIFHFLENDSRRHVAQKLWQALGPSDWGRLYSESFDVESFLHEGLSELSKLIRLIDFMRTAGFFRESLELAEATVSFLIPKNVDEAEWILIFHTSHARILAETHEGTIESHTYLSEVKVALGKYDEALTLRTECLDLVEASFGSLDPGTLSSLNSLGMLQHDLGLREESLATYRRVIRDRSSTLGDEHPCVWESKQNLAVLLTEIGQYDEAILIFEEALDHCLLVRGDDDPVTIAVRNNLAVLLLETEMYSQSSKLLFSVADWQKKHRSPLHLDTLLTENNLARSLEGEGKVVEAEATYRRVVKTLFAEYGTDHPKTPDVVINLAGLLEDLANFDDAIFFYRLAIGGYAKNFGYYDHRTLNAMQMLGVCFREAGELDNAIDILSRLQNYCADGSNRLAAVSSALGLTLQYASDYQSASRQFLKGLIIREELALRGEVSSDQVLQMLKRIELLLGLYPDQALEKLLNDKWSEWSFDN
jgi:tetratricopeptide (TPR) repeat protein